MTQSEFREVLNNTFEKSSNVLDSKRAEYTPEADRLANFKTSAALQNVDPITALGVCLLSILSAFMTIFQEKKRAKNSL